jgi:hypothetical protein
LQEEKRAAMTLTPMKTFLSLDKFGAVFAVLGAAATPCCFPLFTSIGAALGLSAFERFAPQISYAIQFCVVLSLAGSVAAFRKHRVIYPSLIAAAGTVAAFAYYYATPGLSWIYFGFLAIVVSAVWNAWLTRRRPVTLRSTITCPSCGFKKDETMPTDSCQFFYECSSCKALLKPKRGDCCVFCSLGSVPCPPVQLGRGCCA